MAVNRRGVVHACLDAAATERLAQPGAVADAYGEQMVHGGAVRPFCDDPDARSEQLPIARCVRLSRGVPRVQMRQLHAQERRLQAVQSLVVTELHVLALAPLTEVAQPPNPGGEHLVVGANGTPIAERTEILARIEGEGGPHGVRARVPAGVRRPRRSPRVFDT